MVQLSHLYMTTGKTIALTIQTFSSKVMFLLFNTLSSFVKEKKTVIPTGQYWFISPLTSSITRNLFDWPKSLFGFCCKILWKNPNEPEVLIFHLNSSNWFPRRIWLTLSEPYWNQCPRLSHPSANLRRERLEYGMLILVNSHNSWGPPIPLKCLPDDLLTDCSSFLAARWHIYGKGHKLVAWWPYLSTDLFSFSPYI